MGGGLVQAFELMEKSTSYEDWYFVRRIPKEAVSDQLVTSFQPFKKDLIQLSESYWPDYAGLFGEESKAFSIDRFAASCFRVPDALFESRDFWLHLEDEFPELYEEISDLTEEFEKRAGRLMGMQGAGTATLFGLYEPLQGHFHEIEGDMTFFDFAHGLLVLDMEWSNTEIGEFGGDGSGAITMRMDQESKAWKFTLEWSR